jgi:Phage integrase SAM-like domain
VAGLEGPAPKLRVRHPQEGRKRILPTFGDIPLHDLDASTIGAWKSAMLAEQLSPQTVNTYLSLLGTILNAAVDDDYLTRSPLVRKSGAGRTAATRNQPVPRREVWLLREQLDRLVETIDPATGPWCWSPP